MAKVTVNESAIRSLQTDRRILASLEDEALPAIVAEMRRRAPHDTGEGAESIDFELDESGEFYRVTWGKDQFYMYFHEVGTEKMPARPFARPVADMFNRR